MEYLIENDFDAFDDDLEVQELIEIGFPQKIYHRNYHFDGLDDATFFRRFRLSKPTVVQLLTRIEDQLEFINDRNNAVSPINQFLTALRFYATGAHLSLVADYMGIHTATACRIIKKVSAVICTLYQFEIQMPSNGHKMREIQNHFYDIARFPRVIGAIDGTHIKIQSPGGEDGEIFRNRKDYFSINVQAICNGNMEFLDVVARWPGSTQDVTIFNNCRQRAKFENGDYQNSLLLGDSGYNLRSYLLTPLLNPQTPAEQLYNESHIRSRNIIERTFGVWKRRFPVLAYGCRLNIQTTMSVIIACAVLHNVARKMGEAEPPVPEEVNDHELQQLIENGQIPDVPQVDNLYRGNQIRRNFIDNFFGQL